MDAVSPGRVFKKTGHKRAVTIYLAADLREQLEAIAKRETRTLTAQVTHYVKVGLAKDEVSVTSTHKTGD